MSWLQVRVLPGPPPRISSGECSPRMPKSKYLRILVIAVFAAVFFVFPALVRFFTDWLWFRELGLLQVFMRVLSAHAALGAIVFVTVFAVLFANLRLVQSALKERSFTVFGPQGPRTISVDMRRLRPIFSLAAVIAAALIAFYASAKWQVWLMASNAVPFGTRDPIL